MTQAVCRTENVPVKPRCLMTIFVTLCYSVQEDWWNNLLIRFRLSYGSEPHITKISNFIHIIHKSCTLHLSGVRTF